MASFCAARGIQQRLSAPYAHWMNHTAERNMRTIGEMAVTTMIHANLPKSTWGYACLHAIDVINRTAESAELNTAADFPANFSRLERWKGHALPGQTKGLYPFVFSEPSWTHTQHLSSILELIPNHELTCWARYTISTCLFLWT